jgi:nucleoside-diphosphate kinase
MAGNITFTMIKPDAVAAGHIGAILAQINNAGFEIYSLEVYLNYHWRRPGEFYEIHRERGFFNELVDFMSRALS